MVRVPMEAVCDLPKLNLVTCTFASPVTRFDDAMKDIDTEAKYFIAVDMDSAYGQVVADEEAL